MGVLAAVVPVGTAMIVHGAIQFVSNGWRAYLLKEHISWKILGRYLIGGVFAIAGMVFVMRRPDKSAVYLMLGVMAFIPWIPKSIFALDAEKKYQAEILGIIAQGLNTLAGVVGPVLDIFFVKTDLTRQQIVATKAATQVVAHLTKIGFWTLPVFLSADTSILPPLWLIVAAIPVSMFGTWLGGLVLARMTDVSFRDWTKYLLTVIGVVYIARGLGLF